MTCPIRTVADGWRRCFKCGASADSGEEIACRLPNAASQELPAAAPLAATESPELTSPDQLEMRRHVTSAQQPAGAAALPTVRSALCNETCQVAQRVLADVIAPPLSARRWDVLMACSRIRVLGYARGGPQGRDGAIRHIGFEFTSDQAPYSFAELSDGKDRLIEFADALLGEGPVGRGPLKLDTERQVFFYEQDHYYLSNFSAFRLYWMERTFDTSEQAYHWTRFALAPGYAGRPTLQTNVRCAMSAHDAFKLAQEYKAEQRPDWDEVKVAVMRDILRAKAAQHPYVLRKLLQTGERELIENSWRDPYWGWGEDRKGKNMLGRLWMEVRAELRADTQ